MQRLIWTCVVGVVMGLSGAVLGAPVDMAPWPYVADLPVPAPVEKGLVESALTPAVLAAMRDDAADLRLVSPTGEAVAYVLRIDRGAAGQTASYRPARLFNATFVPGKSSTVTVDFGSRAVRTRVDVDTPGANFRRRVLVEAGPDGDTWQILNKAAWLFRIGPEGGAYDKKNVPLPDNDFRYLRITVFNAPDDPERVTIRNVTAWCVQSTAPQMVDVPAKTVAVREDPKIHATEIEVDLAFEKLPLQEITLALGPGDFLRRAEILGRDVTSRTITESVEDGQPRKRVVEEPWCSLTTGTVYHLPAGDGQDAAEGLKLTLTGGRRYLLVRTYNGDDPPLPFVGLTVRRLQEYVAFKADTPGTYRLYWGYAEAPHPDYDLVHYAARLRAEGLTPAALGPARPNPAFALQTPVAPWAERHRWILWAALIFVGGVLGIVLWRQARKVASAPRLGL